MYYRISSRMKFSISVPKTVLSPVRSVMQDLLPPGMPNPLFDCSECHQDLRQHFLKDYLILDIVNLKDEALQKPEGLKYTNLNGKNVNFIKNSEGWLSNGWY